MLDREIELANYEAELVVLDEKIAAADDMVLMSRERECEAEGWQEHKDLLAKINASLKEYGEKSLPKVRQSIEVRLNSFHVDDLMARSKVFVSLNAPDKQDLKSYKGYILQEKPLLKKENRFLERGHDFVSVGERPEYNVLDVMVGKIIDKLMPRNVSMFPLTCRSHRSLHSLLRC